METVLFIVQCGNGGAAMKAGNHASQKSAGGGGAAGAATVTDESGVAISGLPEGVKVFGESDNRTYEFTQGGNIVEFTVREGFSRTQQSEVAFTVNGRTLATDASSESGSAIVSKVSRIMKADAASRPDGFRYTTSAAVGDSRGLTRTALYGRAGFSLPSPGDRLGTQRSVVQDGKMVPASVRFKPLSPRKLKQHQRDVREAVKEGARARRAEQRARAAGLSATTLSAFRMIAANGGPSIEQQMRLAGI